MATKTLTSRIDITASFDYRRIDNLLNPNLIRDRLDYIDLKDALSNGNGTDRANILFHTRSTLDNDLEFWDLDGYLEDVFGDLINYDAVKCLIVKNRTLTNNAFLDVRFKNEVWYIGPNGYRIAWEPYGKGIMPLISSASQEEGRIFVSSNMEITYDIIIAGSTKETSSSSGQ